MKRISIFALLFLSCLFYGCPPSSIILGGYRGEYYTSRIGESVDEFEGIKTEYVNLAMHSLKYLSEIALRFDRLSKNGAVAYQMHSYIYATEWLFVEKIRIKLDGELFEFQSEKEIRDVKDYGNIEELNFYDVDRDFIEKLAQANTVLIRFSGADKYMDVEYKPEHSQLVKQFLAKIE